MEAIKQAVDNGVIIILALIMLGAIGAIGIIVTVEAFLFAGKNVVTDEAFKVTSDTSRYTCIVSEIDNDLSLNCLKIK